MSYSSINISNCLFCNCPSSCSLGQGELIVIRSSTNSSQSSTKSFPRNLDDIPHEKRNNFVLETGKFLAPVDCELFNVGFPSPADLVIDGNVWVHERCLKWSSPDPFRLDDYDFVRKLVLNASKEKCLICDRYGASIGCRTESCESKFHLPCAQSSGGFFGHTMSTFLCPEHLDSVVTTLGNEAASCEACSEPGDVRGHLFCTNCDKHYHGECLMLESNRVIRTGWRCPDCKICQTCRHAGDDAEMIMCNVCDKGYHTFCLRNQSIPKNGWSCSSCLSLTNKTAVPIRPICSLCQNEILSKQSTRQCQTCQSRIHLNCHSISDDYYDDDSIYTCRTCSLSSATTILPIDDIDDDDDSSKVIYSSSSNIKLSRILNRSQKPTNSPSPSSSTISMSTRKLRSIDYSQQSSLEYTPGGGDSNDMTTPATANMNQSEPPFLFEALANIKDESSEHSMDLPIASAIHIPIKHEEEDHQQQAAPIKPSRSTTAHKSGKGKPSIENRNGSGEISKKRARRALNNGHRRASSPQSSSNSNQGTNPNLTRTNNAAGATLRGRPPKTRKEVQNQSASVDENSSMQMNLLNTSTGSGIGGYTVGAVKRDDDEHHAVTVLCGSDELYTLRQDMCVGCGSFGFEEEGRLICCTQCGQAYHSFCAGLNKLSKVILKQGWRCLDCTVCEGCGKPTDESRLLLCDDCDISYHTYCLQPPLDQVPKGNWKCQWCVRCMKCGATSPGPSSSSCTWENNYTECAPCYSLTICPVCTKNYRTDELIVQCTVCDRWLHGACEHILSEDSTLSTGADFVCSLCRPANTVLTSNETLTVVNSPKLSSPSDQAPLLVVAPNQVPTNLPIIPQPQLPTPKATKLDEGVYLTDLGVAQLKSIRVKPLPKKGPGATASGTASNNKGKRGGLAGCLTGSIKRNNSNSVHDDEASGQNTTGAGSGTSDDEGTKKPSATVPTVKAAKGYTGVGGFQVKVRGQRRRPDAVSTTDAGQDDMAHEEVPGTNKRKRDRRPLKKKNFLEEHMPPEMQEAFFGSELAEKSRLLGQSQTPMNPLPLNEQATPAVTNPNNEYIIKLDHETVNRFVIKKAAKLAQAVKEEQRQPPTTPITLPPAMPPPSAEDESEMQDILDNDDFRDFVDYVMNSSKTTQESILPLLDGPTDIDDFLDFIEHPEANNDLQDFSAVDLLDNPNTSNQNQTITTNMNSVQIVQSHQTNMISATNSTHHPILSQGPMQTETSNLVVMATNLNDNSKQIINNLAREMMESTGLHTINTSSLLASQATTANTSVIVKQEFTDHSHIQQQMIITQQQQPQQQQLKQQQQQQQSWPLQNQTMIRIPSMPPTAPITPNNTTPNTDRPSGGTSEAANLFERTREDELLGGDATMSNVLYCNLNHPELKQQFPDFSERFKQMKKIWRKVPTDAKQSYTQRARQNRTKKRAMKSSSGQASNTSKGAKRKSSSKQQLSEPEDNNNDGGGSESRSSTPSSSTTNETSTVVTHLNEHQEHTTAHMYQPPRPMYSPSSNNVMVTTPNSAQGFHHQTYINQQRPQQTSYGATVSGPSGYPQQRCNFPPQQQQQQQSMPPGTPQPQTSQSSPYFDYPPSTPRSVVHQSSSTESTPMHHSLNPNNTNPIRKSNSASDPNPSYHHVSPMEETQAYYQQQSPYPNVNQIKIQPAQQPLLPRGMPARTPQLIPRFPNQEQTNFVRTPTAPSTPGQPTIFSFTSPSTQGTVQQQQQSQPQQQQQQQPTHYVQYTSGVQGQHTIVVQQGTADGFQRMPESPVHQHMTQQPQHHQPSPQFSTHHHPITSNPQSHPILMSQQQTVQHHHMSPYAAQQLAPPLPPQQQPPQQHQHQQPPQQHQHQQLPTQQHQHVNLQQQPTQAPPPTLPQSQQQQQQALHHLHAQHSPTVVIQPPQFSPSSVHHHQLTLNNNSNTQSPTNDLTKRPIQMQKPAQQVLVQHEITSYDESSSKTENHDDSLNESTSSGKIRVDPLQAVPPHILEQIDEVINEVVSGAGVIPNDHGPSSQPPPTNTIQLVPISQAKIPAQHMITTNHTYVQQPSQPQADWSNYQQQQPTLNIAAVRGPAPYSPYHSQQQAPTHHDLLPATTNVINTPGAPQHEQQQIVAERISSILASTSHDQQQQQSQPVTAVSQTPIHLKRTWSMHQHAINENQYIVSTSSNDPSISLEDLLERDFKDKQQQQQQQQQQSTPSNMMNDWNFERPQKQANTSNTNTQQAALNLAHAVHILQQAITHPSYQQSPPPELSGLINTGRDNDITTLNATYSEEQFERYARWLKQRREINSLRIKADETNLADIKKKRTILMRKQKQSLCTPEEEQEMPRLNQQQTEYSRTLTMMRKEKKQFDELEQAFSFYKQSRLNALFPQKSSPTTVTNTNSANTMVASFSTHTGEQTQTDTVVRMISMNNVPTSSIHSVQNSIGETTIAMIYGSTPNNQDEHDDMLHEERSALSPSMSTEFHQKSDNPSIDSTLNSQNTTSYLTLMPVACQSIHEQISGINEHSELNNQMGDDTDNLPFLPCRTSPLRIHDQESIALSVGSMDVNLQSTRIDQLEQ